MNALRTVARGALAGIVLLTLFAELLAPAPYDYQFREELHAPPTNRHPLGTDELGRDRLSRLLHGTRVSLLLASAASALAALLAGVAGLAAAWFGGWIDRLITTSADLFLALPWMFLLLAVRAVLPLETTPMVSVAITFALLGLLGWAGPSRIARAGALAARDADYVVVARAQGCSGWRLLTVHLLPNLRHVMFAQFCISVPLFVLSEANLGLLGLGVSEPLPSWGGLLKELENYSAIADHPWMLAPAALLGAVVAMMRLALPREEKLS
jgi:ABC-type dipeptide/oligopeptide/nickel transport system permease subunit